jgi:hypothetical protein
LGLLIKSSQNNFLRHQDLCMKQMLPVHQL